MLEQTSVDISLAIASLNRYLTVLGHYEECVDAGRIEFDQFYFDYLQRRVSFYSDICSRYQ